MSQLPTDRLDLAIFCARNLTEVQFDSKGRLSGVVPAILQSDELQAALTAADSDPSVYLGRLEFNVQTHCFFENFESYLAAEKRCILSGIPARFYLRSEDFLYAGDPALATDDFKKFYAAAELFDALSDVCDDAEDKLKLVFLSKGHDKIVIKAAQKISGLKDLNGLDAFVAEYIKDSVHKDQKRSVLRSVIFDKFHGQTISIQDVVANFDDIKKAVRDGYEIYADQFSFDEFKNELEEFKREYMIKINKTLTDIQNQMLAIPIATVIAAGQLKNVDSFTVFLTNAVIMVGVVIFWMVLQVVVKNQRSSLIFLMDEIGFKKAKAIQRRDAEYKRKFVEAYGHLEVRAKEIKKDLSRVMVILNTAVCLTAVVFAIRFCW